MIEVTLESLVGNHILTGCARDTEKGDGASFTMILDGRAHTFKEDPLDGYRSCLNKVTVDDRKVGNMFAPVVLEARMSECPDDDIIIFYDISSKMSVRIGTEHYDDCYPCFVAEVIR